MKKISSTKMLVMENLSVAHWLKNKKEEEEEAKFIINILKYTLIKNVQQWILNLKCMIVFEICN